MPYKLSEHITEIQERRRPFGWRLFGWIFYGVTVIALSVAVIVASWVAISFKNSLAAFSGPADCNTAFGRIITEKNTVYLTDGFGGLVEAAVAADRTPETVQAAKARFSETKMAVREAVDARAQWVAAGEPLPCPVGR